MMKQIKATQLVNLMASEDLYAVFDVRERGEYNDEQIPFSTSLPRGQIEFRIAELVPNAKVPIVVYDEGGERAELAAQTLMECGYGDAAILTGGLREWRAAGQETASGVNVPSKAFGEKVYHDRNVPEVTPEDLKKLMDGGNDLTILDMRTPEEYGRFCIPGGVNVPGGELIHWVDELGRKPTVIINCAGRTRSIIGTAGLRRLGLTNVRALKNGTMGWLLAGFQLEHRPTRFGVAKSGDNSARETALRIAAEEAIAFLGVDPLAELLKRRDIGVTYVIDVRSETEFAAGHIEGSINVPGGQAVQRTDDFVAVRNARIVLVSNQSARAVMSAYWFTQMGLRYVSVLQDGLDAWRASGHRIVAGADSVEPLGWADARQSARFVNSSSLREQIANGSLVVLDVSSSLEHETAHLAGAKWISRGWLDIKAPEHFPDRDKSIALTCSDGRQSTLAARQLVQLGYGDVRVLDGGVRAWIAAGLPTESGPTGHLVPANDVVLSPSVRGNREDMQKYLDWELRLKH